MSGAGSFQSLKGMQDILPPESFLWQRVEAAARGVFGAFGFQEVRVPVLEPTGVFVRSIGEQTDIVEKEMYTFEDKGGRSVTLRPEGTASVVRAYVQHNLHALPSPQRFYYAGPMFRYERPQAGRFRQFYQVGVEAFGDPHPRMDAEVILMLVRLLERIGLPDLAVQVNSIGCEACRPAFREELHRFFGGRLDRLCPDCLRRHERNPLRILDCKAAGCREARQGAPQISDVLCPGCRDHHAQLLSMLDRLGVSCTPAPDLVRGLDYYTRTIFEVSSGRLGAQNAVAAGGRYDRLVKEFGGRDTPAVGFAIGMERIIELLKGAADSGIPVPAAFVAPLGSRASVEALAIADRLRSAGYWIEIGEEGASLKSQLRRADRLAARFILFVGDDEIAAGKVTWKRMADAEQGETSVDGIADLLGRC